MKNLIVILSFVGCVQLTVTEPEVCVNESLTIQGTSDSNSALIGQQTESSTKSIDLGIPSVVDIESLTLVPQDSSVTVPENIDALSLNLNDGGLDLVSVENGETIVSNSNIAPYLDGGVLNVTLTVTGTLPTKDTDISAELCFKGTAKVQEGL